MNTKPNVVFIYADDLGRGMLSCYGQKHFNTPNIDKLHNNGTNFTNAHGCHICAPARASLLCGVHDCHNGKWQFTRAGIYRDYAKGDLTLKQVYELIHNTGIEERAGNVFLPSIFKAAGYTTGQIGKLEWGFATTGDAIAAHGWDYHYGFYDHEMCMGYYPQFLFENGERVDIYGNTHLDGGLKHFDEFKAGRESASKENGFAQYSQDLFDEKISTFVQDNKDRPFFLYHPTQLPHSELSIPCLHDDVKNNPELNLSEKVYASMVLRLDETVGKILNTLDKAGIADNTMIIFGSDNGHSYFYANERSGRREDIDESGKPFDHLTNRCTSKSVCDIFDGNNGMTGSKSTNFEGGTRVALMYYWPSKIAAKETNALISNYDFMPTMAELLGVNIDEQKDGLSYLNLLFNGENLGSNHEYIVFASARGPALVTKDGFKLRSYITDKYAFGKFGAFWDEIDGQIIFELYNLNEDYKEENNIINEYPELAIKLQTALIKECDGNLIHGTTQPHFVFYGHNYRELLASNKKASV